MRTWIHLAAGILIASGCAQEASSPFRGNDGRTGEYSVPGVTTLDQIVWKSRLEAPISGAVAITSGGIVAVSTAGKVVSLALKDGDVLWEADLGSPAFGTPVVAGKRILIGTDEGLSALGLDGQVQWTLAGAPVDAAPLVLDGIAYVGDRSGTVMAVDVVGGSLIWSAVTAGPVTTPAVKSGDAVIVGSGDGGVYSLDPATGEPRWSWSAGAAIRGLCATESRIFVSAGRTLFAISADKPDPAEWRADLGSVIDTPPSLSGGVVVAGTGAGQVVALDSTDGSPLFRKDLGYAIRGDIAVTGERLVVPTTRKGIEVVDRAGKDVWSFRTDGRAVAATPDGQRLYVTDSAGSVYALE